MIGGWIVDIGSWRFVFLCIVPFAVAAAWIAFRYEGVVKDPISRKSASIDYAGTALTTLGLAALVSALIAGPDIGFTSVPIAGGLVGGALLLAAFLVVEGRADNPLLPLGVFRSREFVGANLNTLFIYAGLNGLFFLLMLELQNGLGYSALVAGSSLLPTIGRSPPRS